MRPPATAGGMYANFASDDSHQEHTFHRCVLIAALLTAAAPRRFRRASPGHPSFCIKFLMISARHFRLSSTIYAYCRPVPFASFIVNAHVFSSAIFMMACCRGTARSGCPRHFRRHDRLINQSANSLSMPRHRRKRLRINASRVVPDRGSRRRIPRPDHHHRGIRR